jgi:hypothetical protein
MEKDFVMHILFGGFHHVRLHVSKISAYAQMQSAAPYPIAEIHFFK